MITIFLDFVDICCARGLARNRSSSYKGSEDAAKTSHDFRKGSNPRDLPPQKPTEDKRTILKDNSKFISMLCSFLYDKEKFVKESVPRPIHSLQPSSNKSSEVKEKSNETNFDHTSSNKTLHKNLNANQQENIETKPKFDSAPKLAGSFFHKNVEKKNALPRISLRNEGAKLNSQDDAPETEATGNDGTAASKPNDNNPSTRKSVRKWNADVEQDIMKLYESGAPGASLAVLDNQQNDSQRLGSVKEQVDAKLSNAEQTPSYVLALANLFRKRMQVRKV